MFARYVIEASHALLGGTPFKLPADPGGAPRQVIPFSHPGKPYPAAETKSQFTTDEPHAVETKSRKFGHSDPEPEVNRVTHPLP